MMTDTAMGHEAFMAALRHFRDNATTTAEKELSIIALDLYERTAQHPSVMLYLNQRLEGALKERHGS